MSQVLAAVLPGPHQDVEVRSFPEPELAKNSALLSVTLSEVCGTDVHLRDGRLSGVPYPIIPGHVSVGHLEKIHGRMLDVHGRAFREGDAVTFLDVHGTCHACWFCLVAKAYTRCPSRKVYGITYGVADGLCGGWTQKLYLKPGTHCIALDDVPPASFMAGGCSLPTALHAVERAGVAVGDTVLVLGSGPVGLSAMVFAQLRGAQAVYCIGAPMSRLSAARRVGCKDTLDFTSMNMAERLDWIRQRTSGRGADVTIEATGDPKAVWQAMQLTRDAGRVVVVGQYTDRGETTFNPHADLNRKHLDLRGCWGSDFSHFYRVTELMKDPVRRRFWEQLDCVTVGLGQTNEALERVARGDVVKALVDPNADET